MQTALCSVVYLLNSNANGKEKEKKLPSSSFLRVAINRTSSSEPTWAENHGKMSKTRPVARRSLSGGGTATTRTPSTLRQSWIWDSMKVSWGRSGSVLSYNHKEKLSGKSVTSNAVVLVQHQQLMGNKRNTHLPPVQGNQWEKKHFRLRVEDEHVCTALIISPVSRRNTKEWTGRN